MMPVACDGVIDSTLRGIRMMDKKHLPKKKAIYQAVLELFEEGADLNSLTVAEITGKAGIGKGTAYEYFSDKEEMIAKALFYNAEIFCQQLYEGMDRQKNLYDKMNFLLLAMEQHITNMNCIFRMILLSDNSMISRRMKELLEHKRLSEEIPAIDIARRILRNEFQDKKALSAEKMDYLVMSILSKLLCFMMWLKESDNKTGEERDAMRRLVSQGICREVGEMGG